MSEPWYLLRTPARTAAENMAVDEALLHGVAAIGRPVLRFYRWTEPAASFGYFQRYADVEKMTVLRPLVRRPTGGGIVPHDADWTYSLVFPPGQWWYSLKAVESYRQLHLWLQQAFKVCGVASDLAAATNKSLPGQCFAGPERFDLIENGRKIAGAAQRRSREGLLIQGSVQPPAGVVRSNWEETMCASGSAIWHAAWESFSAPAAFEKEVCRLAAEKYGTREYLLAR